MGSAGARSWPQRSTCTQLQIALIGTPLRPARCSPCQAPWFQLHFTPTSSSWLNQIEIFFSMLTAKAIRRGVFASVLALIAAIDAYLAATNTNPKPFIWTKTTDQIIQKANAAA